MANELNDVDAICSGNQLAAVIGCSPRQIDVLRVEGVLSCVRSRLRGRRYRLADSVQRYVAHQKQITKAACSSGGNGDGYNAARARRMIAIAQVQEARSKQVAGEFVRRDRVVEVMTRMLAIVKSHVLHIPSKCSRLIVGRTDH